MTNPTAAAKRLGGGHSPALALELEMHVPLGALYPFAGGFIVVDGVETVAEGSALLEPLCTYTGSRRAGTTRSVDEKSSKQRS
jgi:hypothetical protein